MKIRLKKNDLKTSVEIDPVTSGGKNHFAALIAVTVFHVGEKMGDTAPRVVSTFAGQLSAADAGIYAEGLSLASFICKHAESFGGLEGIYQQLENSGLPNMNALYGESDIGVHCDCNSCRARRGEIQYSKAVH